MSAAIELSRLGWQRLMVACLLATASLGTLFLMLKGYEYYADYEEHMMPFLPAGPTPSPSSPRRGSSSTSTTWRPRCMRSTCHRHRHPARNHLEGLAPRFPGPHQNWIEVYGLYWHFIDLIWIIAFPVLYVVNR